MSCRERHLHYFFCSLAILLGAFQAWVARHTMTADGISYLDISDGLLRGDWKLAINGHWSPMYPVLLAAAQRVFKPDPFRVFSVTHLVNFLAFGATLGCFRFFWRQLRDYEAAQGTDAAVVRSPANAALTDRPSSSLDFVRDAEPVEGVSPSEVEGKGAATSKLGHQPRAGWVGLPRGFYLALVYTVFIWSALRLISVALVTPDMCVAAFVYLACGLLLRVRMRQSSWTAFLFLGLALGLGYLAKAPMLPLALVFLATTLFAAPRLPKAVPRVLAATAALSVVSAPWIVALSLVQGRPTFGASARLNYAWQIDGTAMVHWQGDSPPGLGTPTHPERKIFSEPAVYEFSTPIQGTYPPWFDPTYWNEGLTPRFEMRNQLKILGRSARIYCELFLKGGLGAIALILFAAVGPAQRRRWSRWFGQAWFLLVPALAGMAMYAPVHVEMRYVGAFIVVYWATILTGIRLPDSPRPVRFARALMAIPIVSLLAITLIFNARYLREDVRRVSKVNWSVAQWLSGTGIRPGDRTALMGFGREAYWARLAGVRIVAEMPAENSDRFWSADFALRSQVIGAFARTGAQVIIAEKVPPSAPLAGWSRIDKTDYYAYRLQEPAGSINRP